MDIIAEDFQDSRSLHYSEHHGTIWELRNGPSASCVHLHGQGVLKETSQKKKQKKKKTNTSEDSCTFSIKVKFI